MPVFESAITAKDIVNQEIVSVVTSTITRVYNSLGASVIPNRHRQWMFIQNLSTATFYCKWVRTGNNTNAPSTAPTLTAIDAHFSIPSGGNIFWPVSGTYDLWVFQASGGAAVLASADYL